MIQDTPSRLVRVCRPLFYLVVSTLLLWHLISEVLKGSQFFRFPASSGESVSGFDSFSQPSIAMALLDHEARRRIMLYTDTWEQAPEMDLGQAPELTRPANIPPRRQSPLWEYIRKAETPAQASAFKPLAELHQEVQKLSTDLDGKL